VTNALKEQKLEISSPIKRFVEEIQSAFNVCTIGKVANVAGVHITEKFSGIPIRSLAY